jgi:signal peptidase I
MSLSVVVAIIITNSFIVAPYKVDGTSMKGTLANGQLVAVNKLPVTLNRQFLPTRGEVIIFHPNYGNIIYSDLRVDNLLVKRIAGLPGERIVSFDGKLKVYNSTHPNGYILEDEEPWGKHVTIKKEDAPFDITLGNDQIFVAGDNRPDSIDSRINGALPLSEVLGVVIGY